MGRPLPALNVPMAGIAARCRRDRVRELALFGSALRDDVRLDSDLDYLVGFEPEARATFVTPGQMERGPETRLGRRGDRGPKGGLQPTLREDVLASATVLYAARLSRPRWEERASLPGDSGVALPRIVQTGGRGDPPRRPRGRG